MAKPVKTMSTVAVAFVMSPANPPPPTVQTISKTKMKPMLIVAGSIALFVLTIKAAEPVPTVNMAYVAWVIVALGLVHACVKRRAAPTGCLTARKRARIVVGRVLFKV